MKLTVTKPHEASFDYSVDFKKGDEVHVGREDPEMPGWHWCRDKDGAHSWVPEEYLIIQGDRGALTHDYNTLELTVEQGDELEYVTEVKYWTLLRAGDGAVGWVPTDKLKTQ